MQGSEFPSTRQRHVDLESTRRRRYPLNPPRAHLHRVITLINASLTPEGLNAAYR